MTIEEIAKIIKNTGGNLYLVGGAVRDIIMNRPIKDEDYCVTGILPEEFKRIFPKAREQGKFFEVYVIDNKQFAMARREKKCGKGHKEFEIITNKDITIEEDLERRDLSINAIAQEVLTGKIIDPFNGQDSIRKKTLKAVSLKFKEDPLRVYRVARFAAELDFKVEKRTLNMMNSLKDELQTLSRERVFEELKKAIETKNPSIFFEVLKQADVLDVHFKEINDLIGALQPKKYHPEGDAFNHTMQVLDNCAKLTTDEKIRFSALVHDIGKGQTPSKIYPHHYGHEERGVEPLKSLCNRIGIPTDWKKCGVTAIKEHMRGGLFFKMSIPKQVSFIERVDKSVLRLDGLQLVVYADRARNNEENIINKQYDFTSIGKKMLSRINGKYIEEKYKIKPNKEFGKKLHQERIAWLKNNNNNNNG